jgi:hypothetical protein
VTERLQAYLSDSPVSLQTEDPFAHGDLAVALASTLSEAPAPFTVGLFGPWGSGKSSVLEDVPHHLGAQCAWVIFDAWRYEGDTLRRNFLRELAEALADKQLVRRHGRKYDPERELRDLDVDVQTTGRVRVVASTAYLLQALWAGVVFAGLAYAALQIDSVHDALVGDRPTRAGPITVAVAVVSFAATYLGRLFQAAPETVSRRRVEDPERFMKLFIGLLNRLNVPRLVIAIDNLDRCSPDRAVEVLSTIKTYLDPARVKADKDVVFLIAVDVDALRRHLVAQESERSGDPAGARLYVDEYLRKFFNAHLRIDDPRSDDMAKYVTDELTKVRLGSELKPTDRRRLIQVLAAGLRHNPRRVKQFLNNLELRLRLIRARETVHQDDAAATIVQPISGQVLMIAKLAVIEEEHPRAFLELVQGPHLLREWEAAAVEIRPTGTPGFGHAAPALPAAQPLQSVLEGADGDWLLAFLRVTADITVADVRPFLRYKQSERERKVPNYWGLREAAISGGREELASMLPTDDDAAAFAAVLPEIFREELRAGNRAGARSVVDVWLSVPPLAARTEASGTLLSRALGEPGFYDELRRLPAGPLLDAARGLRSPPLLDRAVDGVIEGLIDPDQPTRRRDSAEALAAHIGEVRTQQRRRLIVALQGPPVADDLDAVGALLGADPELATPELIRHVMTTKLQAGAEGVRQVLALDGLVMALSSALERREPDNLREVLANVLPSAMSAPTSEGLGDFAGTFAATRRLVEKIAEIDGGFLNSYLSASASNLGSLPIHQRDVLADWLLELSERADEGTRASVVANTVNQLLADPSGGGVAWLRDRLKRLRALSATALGDQLQNVASAPRPDRDDLITLALAADPDNQPARAQQIAAQLSGQGDVAALRDLVHRMGHGLDASLSAFAQNLAAGWSGFTPDIQIDALRLVREWSPNSPDTGAFSALRSMLESALPGSDDPDVARAAASIAGGLSALAGSPTIDQANLEITRQQAVDAALTRAEGADLPDEAALGLVDGLFEQRPQLSDSQRERLDSLLARWTTTHSELVRNRYKRPQDAN